MRRLDAIEARLRALEKPVQPPQAVTTTSGVVCGRCGADRTQEPCRLADITHCMFLRATA